MTIELDVPRQRPTTSQPGHGPGVAPGGARPLLVPPGASAAAEARRTPVQAIVGRLQSELGVREAIAIEAYGPTSYLSEDLLLQGYGLGRPRSLGELR